MKKTKKQTKEKQKTIFIIIGAIVGMFLIYNLFLSPYAQCVSGYIKYENYPSDKAKLKAKAKITCKALGK